MVLQRRVLGQDLLLCGSCFGISIHSFTVRAAVYSHDSSAQEGDTNHEHPAGNNSEEPENISKRNSKTVFGELAIEWVEPTLVWGDLLPVSSLVEVDESLGSSGGEVHVFGSDINRRGRSRNTEEPESRRARSPSIAENGLRIAVEVREMRRSRINAPEKGSLVERGLDLLALSEAGLVASGYQNPPFFWLRAGGLDARADGVLPVCQSEYVEGLASDFGSGGGRCVCLRCLGDIGLEFVEPVLSLSLNLLKWRFLLGRSSEEWQSQEREI